MSAQNAPLYRPKPALDLLALPVLGAVLKKPYGRLVLQLPFALVALALLYDGFTGPQNAARNLATVVPWVHYRGLVVIAILLAGNLFCMGCPFTLPRTLARRLSIRGRRFPRVLRGKWLAIGSLFTLFFVYEWLDLWSSPLLTAWVIVAYFVASFVLEAWFTESAFCKYVCPLGTFNFVYSTVSPTRIGVHNPDVCQTCVGKECVNGSWSAQPVIRIDQIAVGGQMVEKRVEHSPNGVLGCGTELFPPQIRSNLDCVFCLDCVRACPHDNIGLMVRPFGQELSARDGWLKRWDVSLLVIALAFMGVVNAFGMVPPMYALLENMAAWGVQAEWLALLLIFAGGSLLLPLLVALAAGWIGRTLTGTTAKHSLRDTVAAFAPAFVPIGFGIWLAHYGFHFLIAPLSIIPVLQEFLGMVGEWERFSVSVDLNLIGLLQVVALLGGFLGSLVVAQKAALRLYGKQSFAGLMPWALVLLLLMVAAYQVFSMPMEMRGTEQIFSALLLS